MATYHSRLGHLITRSLGTGFVATQALDVVSAWLYENLSPEIREEEDRVRNGRQAYEVAVARAADHFGYALNGDEIKYWGWKFHRAFGILGGLQYVLLRKMYPKVGQGMGLAYGLGFFLVVDELVIYLAKLTPGPTKFSWRTHLRGAIAHLAYGVAAELTYRSFDKISAYERGVGAAQWENSGRHKRVDASSAEPQKPDYQMPVYLS